MDHMAVAFQGFMDEIFSNFYSRILKQEHLSGFFASEEMIRNLMVKQKANLLESMGEPEEVLFDRYRALAEKHIHMGLSLPDYFEAFNVLQEESLRIIIREKMPHETVDELGAFFGSLRQATAYGYMMDLVRRYRSISDLCDAKCAAFKPLDALMRLLSLSYDAAESGDMAIMDSIDDPCETEAWFDSMEAGMIAPDEGVRKRLMAAHYDIHRQCGSLKYYISKKLFYQSYSLLKDVTNSGLLFKGELEAVLAAFEKEKEKRFFGLLRTTGNYMFSMRMERAQLMTELYGMDYAADVMGSLKKSLSERLGSEGLALILSAKLDLLGVTRGIQRQALQDALLSLKEGLERDESDRSLSLKVYIMDAAACREFYDHPYYYDKIISMMSEKSPATGVYTAAEADLAEIKDMMEAELKKQEYSKRIFEPGRLDVFFQPVVGLRTGKIYDFETLVRYKSDEGYVSAYMFIDFLYQTGHIMELDRRVLDKLIEYSPLIKTITERVFINMSPTSLQSEESREYMESMIGRLKADSITPFFEITEQAVIENFDLILHLSGRHGIRFVIDDFGTGYSSLKTIAVLAEKEAISHIKIDGSLTKRLFDSEEIYKIVKSISKMAKSLGIKTVAEFVEDERTVNRLIELDIDYGQGFHYSAPKRIVEFLNTPVGGPTRAPAGG